MKTPPAAGANHRVLIVEDDHVIAGNLYSFLEARGFLPDVAYSGPAALQRLQEQRFDAVLLDIGLPGMDGYEVARALRADDSLKGAFLVALTGYARPEDLQRAREAGFDRHLAKPASLEALEEVLKSRSRAGGAAVRT